MEYQAIYNLIVNIAKGLKKPQSFVAVLELLKINNTNPDQFFESIKKYYDALISSFIIFRTQFTSRLGVDLYYEREMVASILSAAKVQHDNTRIINNTFEQNGLKFRLPNALNASQLELIQNIIIANNCIDICRIGNYSDKISEISFYARYYTKFNPTEITKIHQEFSKTMKFVLDNILEMPTVKQKIINELRQHGRANGIMQNDSIDKLFRILDHEIAAMEVVLEADKNNWNINADNLYDYVTQWLLSQDFKRRRNNVAEINKTQ